MTQNYLIIAISFIAIFYVKISSVTRALPYRSFCPNYPILTWPLTFFLLVNFSQTHSTFSQMSKWQMTNDKLSQNISFLIGVESFLWLSFISRIPLARITSSSLLKTTTLQFKIKALQESTFEIQTSNPEKKHIFSSQFWPLLNGASFLEVAETVVNIGSSLNPNYHDQIELV